MIPIEQLFPTEAEKNEAREALEILRKSSGWKVVEKLLDFDIEKLDNDLKTLNFESLEHQRQVQDRYATRVLLKSLPEDIIRALSNEPSADEKVELDPYEDSSSSKEKPGETRG